MCAQAHKALKEMQDKLQEEVAAHQHTSEALTQRIYMEARAEQKILEMREEAKKQKQWFEEHLTKPDLSSKTGNRPVKQNWKSVGNKTGYGKQNQNQNRLANRNRSATKPEAIGDGFRDEVEPAIRRDWIMQRNKVK